MNSQLYVSERHGKCLFCTPVGSSKILRHPRAGPALLAAGRYRRDGQLPESLPIME